MQDQYTGKNTFSKTIKLKKVLRITTATAATTLDDLVENHTVHGKRHRKDGPARVFKSGREEWWLYGVEHREDGPAFINRDNREEEWFFRGEYHRDGGPAITLTSGSTHWYSHGSLHREDGPAIVSSTIIEWHLGGQKIKSSKEYQELVGLADEDMIALLLKYGNRFNEYR